ncbi:hypothetical protein A2U01_0076065, partial [Trifolium medium]|nr:hypothetical protein [Trifolium medium]
LYIDGFPIISEADDEEVILIFVEDVLRTHGVFVPRSMVPPASEVEHYQPRKRKRNQKSSEEEEPKLKEVKKEAGTTSESVKEKVVAEKTKVVAEK